MMDALTVQRMTLDDSTARKLRRLTERIDTADEKRDQLMAEAAGRGASLRELAAVTGLNYVTVRNRIRKITAAGSPTAENQPQAADEHGERWRGSGPGR